MAFTPWGFDPKREKRKVFRDPKTGRFVPRESAIRRRIKASPLVVDRGPGGLFLSKKDAKALRRAVRENRKAKRVVRPVLPVRRRAKAPVPGVPVKDSKGRWRDSETGRFLKEKDALRVVKKTLKKAAEKKPKPRVVPKEREEIERVVFERQNASEMIVFQSVRDILTEWGFFEAVASIRDLRSSTFTIHLSVNAQLILPGEDKPRNFRRDLDAVVKNPEYRKLPEGERKKLFYKIYDYGVPAKDIENTVVHGIYACIKQLINDVKDYLGESPTVEMVVGMGLNLLFFLEAVTVTQKKEA